MNGIKVYHLRKNTELKSVKNGVETIQKHSAPYATVAITINPDKTVNRGVAILSRKDENKFSKTLGTSIATGRLASASKLRQNQHEISKSNKKSVIVQNGIEFKYLASVNDTPTDYEKKIFARELAE